MNTVIRPMRLQDRSRIAGLLAEIAQFKPAEVVVALELIDAYLTGGTLSGYHVLVAEKEDSTAGYICFGPTPLTENTWDIYWEAVSPVYQGQGIGGSLLEAGEKTIQRHAGKLILIETSSTQLYAATREFYRKHGYQLTGRIPEFYSPGDDLMIYSKRMPVCENT